MSKKQPANMRIRKNLVESLSDLGEVGAITKEDLEDFKQELLEPDETSPEVKQMLVVIGVKMAKAGYERGQIVKKIKELSRCSREEVEKEFNKWF